MLGKQTAQTALHYGANDLDGGELTEAYAVENAGFDAVERDTVYNRVEKVAI